MAASGSSPLPEKTTPAPHPNLQCHHIAADSSFQQFQQPSAFDEFVSSSAAKKSTRQGERERSDSDYIQPFSPGSRASERSFSRGSRHARHSSVRTLPSWIDSVEVLYGEDSKPTDRLLSRPPPSVSAQHHYAMNMLERRVSKDGYIDTHPDVSTAAKAVPERNIFGTAREPVKGRKWDHAREGDPVIVQSHGTGSSPWSTFVKASMYGPAVGEEGETVGQGFLDEQTPGYYQPWRGDAPGEDPEKALGLLHSKKRRRLVWYQRAQRSILMHPLVPLAFRLTVLATSTIALGLSASIFHLTRSTAFSQSPSAIMAIVVDVIALPYIGYITWDEYTAKPLGLRSPKVKVRLVLLDLFFIIFESANLALAFQTLTDHDGVCHAGPVGPKAMDTNLCQQGKALAAILLIALVAWSLTFSVSIIRLVQRVGGREEQD